MTRGQTMRAEAHFRAGAEASARGGLTDELWTLITAYAACRVDCDRSNGAINQRQLKLAESNLRALLAEPKTERDPISSSKRILALVDDYEHFKTKESRDVLRHALLDEFTARTPSGAEPAFTYSSQQATNCASCGLHKHTPLRVDRMGGYVCLTCIDKELDELLDAVAERPSGAEPSDRERWNAENPGEMCLHAFDDERPSGAELPALTDAEIDALMREHLSSYMWQGCEPDANQLRAYARAILAASSRKEQP